MDGDSTLVARGCDHVRVRFRPAPGGSIGAIFDVRILRPGAAH